MGQYSKDLSFDHTSKKSKKSSTCPQSATKRTSSFKKKSQRRQRLKSLRPLRRLQWNLKKRQKNKVFMCTKAEYQISKSSWHSYHLYNNKSDTPKNTKSSANSFYPKNLYSTLFKYVQILLHMYDIIARLTGAMNKNHDF